MYQTSLTLTAKDRDGLLLDIAQALTAIKIRVRSLTAREIGGIGTAFISLEVKDLKEVQTAINKLSGISGVIDVKRSST